MVTDDKDFLKEWESIHEKGLGKFMFGSIPYLTVLIITGIMIKIQYQVVKALPFCVLFLTGISIIVSRLLKWNRFKNRYNSIILKDQEHN